MKGSYQGARYSAGFIPRGGWTAGVYTDARGVAWDVTPDSPDTGETTWTARSRSDADAGTWRTGDWSQLFDDIDNFAAGAARAGGGGGWLALALLVVLVLTDRGRR